MTAVDVFHFSATFGAFSALLYRLWSAQHPPRWMSWDALQWVGFGAAHLVAFGSVTYRLFRLTSGLPTLQVNTSVFYLAIAIVLLVPVPHYDHRP